MAKEPKSARAGTRHTKQVLMIVESPAKGKTIEKYLGKGYTVAASMGHLIDLPKSRLAIDVEQSFEPEYITVRGKAKILKELKQKAKKADAVLLASDNDREGEAISFHLKNALSNGSTTPDIQRDHVQRDHPQGNPGSRGPSRARSTCRRSTLRRPGECWTGSSAIPFPRFSGRKVKNGLSAGRVQSVALRLICEREAEIEAFLPEEYWSLEAELRKGQNARQTFKAALVAVRGEKPDLKNEASTTAIVDSLKGASFAVSDVKVTEKLSRPRPPFTTSTLQQTAANRFGFTARKTMQIAQGLYEGVNVGSQRLGLITYMRTDSTRIAESALAEVREYIAKEFPGDLPEAPVVYVTRQRRAGRA